MSKVKKIIALLVAGIFLLAQMDLVWALELPNLSRGYGKNSSYSKITPYSGKFFLPNKKTVRASTLTIPPGTKGFSIYNSGEGMGYIYQLPQPIEPQKFKILSVEPGKAENNGESFSILSKPEVIPEVVTPKAVIPDAPPIPTFLGTPVYDKGKEIGTTWTGTDPVTGIIYKDYTVTTQHWKEKGKEFICKEYSGGYRKEDKYTYFSGYKEKYEYKYEYHKQGELLEKTQDGTVYIGRGEHPDKPLLDSSGCPVANCKITYYGFSQEFIYNNKQELSDIIKSGEYIVEISWVTDLSLVMPYVILPEGTYDSKAKITAIKNSGGQPFRLRLIYNEGELVYHSVDGILYQESSTTYYSEYSISSNRVFGKFLVSNLPLYLIDLRDIYGSRDDILGSFKNLNEKGLSSISTEDKIKVVCTLTDFLNEIIILDNDDSVDFTMIDYFNSRSSKDRFLPLELLNKLISDEEVSNKLTQEQKENMEKAVNSFVTLVITDEGVGESPNRREIVEELGRKGKGMVVEPLISILKDEKSNKTSQWLAVMALGKTGDARVVEPLIEIGKRDAGFLGLCAGNVLKNIGEPAIQPLIELLGDETLVGGKYAVGDWASWSLAEIGVAVVEPSIAELKEKKDNPQVVKRIIYILGKTKPGSAAAEHLVKVLGDEDIGSSVAEALSRIGAPAVEPLIEAVINNSDPNLRENAKEALARLGNFAFISVLEKLLNSDNQELQKVGSDIISKMGYYHQGDYCYKDINVLELKSESKQDLESIALNSPYPVIRAIALFYIGRNFKDEEFLRGYLFEDKDDKLYVKNKEATKLEMAAILATGIPKEADWWGKLANKNERVEYLKLVLRGDFTNERPFIWETNWGWRCESFARQLTLNFRGLDEADSAERERFKNSDFTIPSVGYGIPLYDAASGIHAFNAIFVGEGEINSNVENWVFIEPQRDLFLPEFMGSEVIVYLKSSSEGEILSVSTEGYVGGEGIWVPVYPIDGKGRAILTDLPYEEQADLIFKGFQGGGIVKFSKSGSWVYPKIRWRIAESFLTAPLEVQARVVKKIYEHGGWFDFDSGLEHALGDKTWAFMEGIRMTIREESWTLVEGIWRKVNCNLVYEHYSVVGFNPSEHGLKKPDEQIRYEGVPIYKSSETYWFLWKTEKGGTLIPFKAEGEDALEIVKIAIKGGLIGEKAREMKLIP